MLNIRNIIERVIPENLVALPVTVATYWEESGIRYPLKKNEVFFKRDEIDDNMLIAQWFTQKTGRPVQLQPIVVNPSKIRTCDFILTDDNTKLELKTITISEDEYNPNKNYINKALGNGYGQANCFIIDITGCPFLRDKVIDDLDIAMGYTNRKYVTRVYLKYEDELIGIFERK